MPLMLFLRFLIRKLKPRWQGSDTVEALECLRSWLKIKDSEMEALIRLAAKIREDGDNVDNTGVEKEAT